MLPRINVILDATQRAREFKTLMAQLPEPWLAAARTVEQGGGASVTALYVALTFCSTLESEDTLSRGDRQWATALRCRISRWLIDGGVKVPGDIAKITAEYNRRLAERGLRFSSGRKKGTENALTQLLRAMLRDEPRMTLPEVIRNLRMFSNDGNTPQLDIEIRKVTSDGVEWEGPDGKRRWVARRTIRNRVTAIKKEIKKETSDRLS